MTIKYTNSQECPIDCCIETANSSIKYRGNQECDSFWALLTEKVEKILKEGPRAIYSYREKISISSEADRPILLIYEYRGRKTKRHVIEIGDYENNPRMHIVNYICEYTSDFKQLIRYLDEIVKSNGQTYPRNRTKKTGLANESEVQDIEVNQDSVFTVDNVDVRPDFVGGEKCLLDYIQNRIAMIEDTIHGRSVVGFIIEKDGSIGCPYLLKTSTPELDKYAISIIREMPLWMPGRKNGKTVRTKLAIPILKK